MFRQHPHTIVFDFPSSWRQGKNRKVMVGNPTILFFCSAVAVCTVQYITVYGTAQYSATQYGTVQHSQYTAVRADIIQYSRV